MDKLVSVSEAAELAEYLFDMGLICGFAVGVCLTLFALILIDAW